MAESHDFASRSDGATVVAYGVSTAEAAVLAANAGALRVQFCRHVRATETAVADPRVVGAVMTLSAESDTDLRIITDALGRRAIPIPLLLRFDLSAAAIRQVLECADAVYDLRVSVRGFDPLQRCIANVSASTDEQAARRVIASAIAPVIPSSVLDIVIGAVVMGDRRSTVRDLAGLCGRSCRRLEEQLAAVGTLPAKRLLMESLVLHTQWRISRLGWTPGRAAARAGFRSVDALSRRVERATGARLGILNKSLTFSAELEQFRSVLQGAATSGA